MKSECQTALLAGERIDDLQTKGYRIIQNRKLYCFGADAVLLSSYAKLKPDERCLDLGSGTGVIPILMCAKNEDNTFRAHKDADCFSKTKSEGGGTKNIREGLRFIGLEIQEELAEMSRRSIILNGLEKEIEIVTGDIITATETFGNQAFDVITVNPPYMLAGHGIYCKNPSYDIAKHEIKVKLDDILRESAKLLKQGGRFYMVHRPYRLPEIFSKMVCFGIEPKRMRLVQSYADSPPTMVLIEGRNGGNRRLSVEPALILYEEQGVYTKEALTFYGDN